VVVLRTCRIMCTLGSCALISTIVNNGTSRSAPIVSLLPVRVHTVSTGQSIVICVQKARNGTVKVLPEASIASRSSHLEASDRMFIISCNITDDGQHHVQESQQ
jgi:hypothetical protein